MDAGKTNVIEGRVRRGAELLDKVRPGWWKAIDLDQLAMEDCHWCIIGQVFGDYVWGFHDLVRTLPGGRHLMASDLGFSVLLPYATHADLRLGCFRHLADLWRVEVRTRANRSTTAPAHTPAPALAP